jgi:tetratricopeptide (TPR) repeat protein
MLEGLGDYHFPTTTQSIESQQFFDQGLRLTYAFNHSEALRAFKQAVMLDPNNAMAYLGWALVLGPNLNLPMVPEVAPQAYRAIKRAVALLDKVSEREQAYIRAMAERYTDNSVADRKLLDQAYARAMAKLVKRYPDDLDAATLYAASLMNLSPWDYWNLDGSPKGHTEEILDTLQSVVDRNPKHARALHYYFHNEPPDWYFPVRHFLGAMLLDSGQPNEAEVVYAADLRNNPGNGYSLFGLKLALEQQGKVEDARAVAKRFDRAWADATHKLNSSRF